MKYSEPSSVSVRHWCEAVPGQPSRMIERVGRDEASAIDAWNTRALLAEQARPTQVMQEARETLLIAAANFEGVAPSARDRCIRAANALHEVYTAQPLKAEQAKDAAEDAELLDERGDLRCDLPSPRYKVGNEFKPFHPRASHVRPEWRDGWNACFVAAIKAQGGKQ